MDTRWIFFYFWCQFLFQRAMTFRNFDHQLYVLFSVLYMRKTPIKQGKLVVQPRLQLTILYICTADTSVYFPSRHDWKIVDWDVKPQHNQPTSVYFETEYLPPDVKVFSCMMSSLASTILFPSPFRPKMPLTYVVNICGDISLTKGHLGWEGVYLKINLNTRN